MTPEQRQQIRDLIAAGEKATGFFWRESLDDFRKSMIEAVTPKRKKFKHWVLIAWCGDPILDDENIDFICQAANAREAIEAMEKENERLREALGHLSAPDMWLETADGELVWKGADDPIDIYNKALTNETKESE